MGELSKAIWYTRLVRRCFVRVPFVVYFSELLHSDGAAVTGADCFDQTDGSCSQRSSENWMATLLLSDEAQQTAALLLSHHTSQVVILRTAPVTGPAFLLLQ